MKILCYACNTHILNLLVEKLAYPFFADMFEPVVTNWRLPTGQLVTDIFCPRCGAFPFHHDPNIPGARGVGPYLKTQGGDGKPVILHFDQLKAILGQLGVKLAAPEAPQAPIPEKARPEPAPEKSAKADKGGKSRTTKKGGPVPQTEQPDPVLVGVMAQVEGKGASDASPEPTPEEIKEMLAEREARLVRGKERPQTRPMGE